MHVPVDDALHLVGDHRPDQVFLGGEMPIDRSGADAGTPRYLVDRYRQPVGGEGFQGSFQYARTVSGRVGAHGPFGLSHVTSPR